MGVLPYPFPQQTEDSVLIPSLQSPKKSQPI